MDQKTKDKELIESLGVFVFKKHGEKARRILDELQVISQDLRPFAKEEMLVIPVTRELENSEIESIGKEIYIKAEKGYFEERKRQLQVKDLLGFDPTMEIIGDIAIIEDNEKKHEIAEAIMKCNKNVKTVLLTDGPVFGEFRIKKFKYVSGEEKTNTIYKEYGCIYHIDLEKAYFTQRLSTERSRVLEKIKETDTVIDMFAGIGPYSILIAKKKKPKLVIANDKNPEAVKLLIKNIEENKVKNIKALNCDAKDLPKYFEKKADHVIMNLPCNAHVFLDEAVKITRPGGIIYYYAMTEEENLFSKDMEMIKDAAKQNKRSVTIIDKRKIRSYAPHQYNICIEAKID